MAEGPCLVEKVMGEEENDLDDCDEGYESLSAGHLSLDSERLAGILERNRVKKGGFLPSKKLFFRY
jgi:hypothetical protein